MILSGCSEPKHLTDKIVWQKFDTIAANFPAAPYAGSKPILLYFKQNNCHYCEEQDSVFARPEVAWYVNENYLPVCVNVDTDMPLHTRGEEISYQRLFKLFKMEGFPCYYAFDSTGGILGMSERSMHLLVFKQTLKYIREGQFGKTPFDEYTKKRGVPQDTTFGVF